MLNLLKFQGGMEVRYSLKGKFRVLVHTLKVMINIRISKPFLINQYVIVVQIRLYSLFFSIFSRVQTLNKINQFGKSKNCEAVGGACLQERWFGKHSGTILRLGRPVIIQDEVGTLSSSSQNRSGTTTLRVWCYKQQNIALL